MKKIECVCMCECVCIKCNVNINFNINITWQTSKNTIFNFSVQQIFYLPKNLNRSTYINVRFICDIMSRVNDKKLHAS